MTLPSTEAFPSSPATIVIGDELKGQLWIASEVRLAQDEWSDVPVTVLARARGEEKAFPCSRLHEAGLGRWVGRLWSDTGNGYPITVRPTREGDAVKAITMDGMPRVPTPISVISDVHDNDGTFTTPELFAVTDHAGAFFGLMLFSDVGMFFRHRGSWHLLEDVTAVADLPTHTVADCAVSVYDRLTGDAVSSRQGVGGEGAERLGHMIRIDQLANDIRDGGIKPKDALALLKANEVLVWPEMPAPSTWGEMEDRGANASGIHHALAAVGAAALSGQFSAEIARLRSENQTIA